MIRIEGIGKVYKHKVILQGITVEFLPGCIYGLVGENGSGKTTLMRCICGFTQPTSGKVYVDGKQIGKDADFAPSTGIIIETPGFLPQYSGLKNLLLLAQMSGKVTKQGCRDAMSRLGLDPGDKKPVGQYSLGMRQRLGIAQALMENPDNLLLDEPFNGLDQSGIEDMHGLLKMLKKEKKTIVLASHSAQDIERACDEVYIIQNNNLIKREGIHAQIHDSVC